MCASKEKDETHPEGSYFIEWWDRGKRYREAVGPDGFQAADKARTKQAELSAIKNGIIPAQPVPEPAPERTTVAAALDRYSEYIQYHRSLRTFRTYRPILASFKSFCPRTYVEDVDREDLLAFGNVLHEARTEGQERLQQARRALAGSETERKNEGPQNRRLAKLC